uniref:Protein ripply3 n=1 Tax=Sus scrofa TaxID=9823 RepID=A0A8D1KN44_PIG
AAATTACGSSQARGRIGAAATGLHHSHRNTRSKPHLQPTLQGSLTVCVYGSVFQLEPGDDQQPLGSKGAFGFQHPVRLYLPISKRQEYLQSSGEKVLASFPVQATIHFYDDASESEEEQEEETQPSDLQDQEAEDSSGRKGRDRQINPERGPGGPGGHSGKGPLPHYDSPEDAEYPWSK